MLPLLLAAAAAFVAAAALLQDYKKPCPQKQPTAEALAQRTTAPKVKPAAAAPPLSKNLNPPGSEAAVCNAYIPMGTSTMARFLWVVQYFVANGFYVLVDYHPEPGNAEPVTDSVQVYSNNWLRLWAGLSCLPNYKQELQGRVFLDLLNGEPGTTGRGAWGLKIGVLVLNPKLKVDCSEWQHDSTWGGATAGLSSRELTMVHVAAAAVATAPRFSV
jgi:hypothetical protein